MWTGADAFGCKFPCTGACVKTIFGRKTQPPIMHHLASIRTPCTLLYRRPGDPDGIRTRVAALKGPCPRPLDDGAKNLSVYLREGNRQEARGRRKGAVLRQTGVPLLALRVASSAPRLRGSNREIRDERLS